jgi:pimeloyl-ACP methyl ester carboxylesterase
MLATLLLSLALGAAPVAVAPAESLHVTVGGEPGPAVVLIPGLLGSAYGYRQLTPLLEEAGFRTIVIEPLGVGHSSRPQGADYSLGAQAGRIGAVLRRADVAPVIVVAHGLGASMAYRLALDEPELVRGIVSIEGGAAETAASPGLSTVMNFAPFLKAVAGEGLVKGRLRAALRKASGNPEWVTEAVVEGYSRPLLLDFGATAAAYRAMADSRESGPLAPRLPGLAVPIEMLLGGAPHDYAVPIEELARLRDAAPDFRSVAVPGAGHYIHEENPAAVVVAVRRLLRRLESLEEVPR